MILQTGMRTDIPAFYAPWFLNRVKEGYALVRSPYDPSTVFRYRISPDVVDLIGFCTKNPAPLLPHMAALRDYGQYWHVTITPYGPDVEPHVPPKERVMESFRRLSDIAGPRAVDWRYDPVLLTDTYTVRRHIDDFAAMAARLAGYTTVCVVSFIDLYEKVKRNFPEIRSVPREDRLALGKAFVQIARENGMRLKTCGEGDELAPLGADCGGCITPADYERALGKRLRFPRFKPSRPQCACYLGGDIGAYDTCGHLCRYCYANSDPRAAQANLRAHDHASPLLLGRLLPTDQVRDARQESWLDPQMSMF